METRRWSVEVEFDELDLQVARDPECAFPNDECSRVIGSLIDAWAMLPEDLKEIAEWTTAKLNLSSTPSMRSSTSSAPSGATASPSQYK